MKVRTLALLGLALALLTTLGSAGHAGPRLLVLGDSLSAAYGIPVEYGWVSLLDEHLNQAGRNIAVVNASISGETSAGGAARLPALLADHRPAIVIIELGGNDGLRGLSLTELGENLGNMVRLSLASGARVLLVGMRIPPNYGKRYTEAFYAAYTRIAEEEQVPLVPFFLEGVAGHAELMQADGIHPTAAAQPLMLANVLPALAPLLTGLPVASP